MASTDTQTKSEIVSWLEVVLKDDNLKDITIKNLGNTEKGDGYMGDIVFVTADGTTPDGSTKEYNLVLKCSKRSQVLRETTTISEAYVNEIKLYEKILPEFISFQKEKQIDDVFDSIPKCYGTYTSENMEVIVLENLKNVGYDLWPKKAPLNKSHFELIIKKYSQFHATSVAISKQQPEVFQKWVSLLEDSFKKSEEKPMDNEKIFSPPIEESYDLLKNDLDEDVLLKWRNVKEQINFIMKDLPESHTGLKLIAHGDCWNNNFMFFYDDNTKETPSKVAFLDWQFSRHTSPIIDLSYFIFSCSSQNELANLDNILTLYHSSFVEHLGKLNIQQPETVYPFEEFLNDWKILAKYGIVVSSLLMKICTTDKEDVVDIVETAESGKNFEDTFNTKIKDTETYKKRIRPIVEYAVKYNLI